MNLKKDKYIILEIIPTAIHPSKGDIVQISAIKLNGLNLLDRFDYRLKEEQIYLEEFKKLISYDKDSFIYLDSSKELLDTFVQSNRPKFKGTIDSLDDIMYGPILRYNK